MELYEILGAHIPEDTEGITAWDFIGKIIRDINSSDDHSSYTLAMELMSEKTLQGLQEMLPEERLELFTGGLIQNKIMELKSFCEQVGFAHG